MIVIVYLLEQVYFVVKAAEMIKEGKTIEEVFKALDEIKEKSVLMFSVDTLEYLKKRWKNIFN